MRRAPVPLARLPGTPWAVQSGSQAVNPWPVLSPPLGLLSEFLWPNPAGSWKPWALVMKAHSLGQRPCWGKEVCDSRQHTVGSLPAPLKGAPSAGLSMATGAHGEPRPRERMLMPICFAPHIPSPPAPVNLSPVGPRSPTSEENLLSPWPLSALWRGAVTCWSPRCPAFPGSLSGRISESVWQSRAYVTGLAM